MTLRDYRRLIDELSDERPWWWPDLYEPGAPDPEMQAYYQALAHLARERAAAPAPNPAERDLAAELTAWAFEELDDDLLAA